MAEFALGLTKSAVEGTLVRVKSAIDEEAMLKEKVQNDLVFITGEFEMMRSFLYGANTAERAKNTVVRTWVRQLRDLAFDVEDWVDFVVHLDTKKSDWWLRVVPSCIAPPLPVDVAVAQIQQLKARVEYVSKRNDRYNLIGDDSMLPKQLIPVATASSSTFDTLGKVWKAAGKLRVTGDLKKLITSEGDDLQVISLWQGSCSTEAAATHHDHHHHHHHHLETTYIIKKAYDDPEICQRFKSHAWIKVMHPFNPDEFLKTLLAQFYPPGSTDHQSKALGGAELRKKMRAAVAEEDDSIKAKLMHQVSDEGRYLLVLEGVSTVVEWDAIRMYLPDSNNGSRIVVSTVHLRIALLCTREPYQVSQLRRFSDGQFLCAFSSKGSVRRSDIGEFNWKIRCGGVISVVGESIGFGRVVRRVYECILRKRKGFDGAVVFEKHSWVDVPEPFDINDFALCLFLSFQPRHLEPEDIIEVGKKGDQCVIERCCKYLHEDDCLVVINGLKAPGDWDKIKITFLSKPATKNKKTSIIVLTDDDTLAKHCVQDQQARVFNMEALEHDKVLYRLTKQDTGISIGVEDSFFYDRIEEAFDWNNLKLDGREKELSTVAKHFQNPNPGVISVWGPSGAGKSTLVRKFYSRQVLSESAQVFSWVDVPHPFNLSNFAWRLLLGFKSSREEKKAAAAGLMKGQHPIQACREFLHERKQLVVIDGLQSKKDWDTIRETFFSEPPTQSGSYIIVITIKKSVAKHFVDDNEDRLLKVKRLRNAESLNSVKDPHFFVGRGNEKHELRQHFESPGVISLWGIAGVGKSALVKNILNSMHIFNYDKEKMSWVDVPHPFHLMEFSCRLLLGFYSMDLNAQETAAVGIMEGQDTVQACCNFLRQDKCRVVIDGLGSTHDWDLIEATFLSKPTQRSCIIVITTEAIVATHCASHKGRVHNVKGLDTTDACHLFTKIARRRRQFAPEKKLVKATMAKCGGLPKVISAIAEYLPKDFSEMVKISETTLTTILGDIHDDFMAKLETEPRFNLKGLFSWMQSYFDACSDSLKPCIFYLSVFPSHQKRIRRRRLLRRWVAEGYSRDTSGGGTAEENGEKLFIELVESSIIQLRQKPSNNNKVDDSVCEVNGFFHEYIISRPMMDNLVFALEGHCKLNSQRTGQHLTIRSSWDRNKIVFESMDFTRLRSLTVFGEWMPFFVSADMNMRLLRVLDLEDTSGVTDDDLEQIGKLLPRLKFLSLRGCNDITHLPESLGGLRQLQTLDVRHTKIVTLPHAITRLVKLQYVRAGTMHQPLGEPLDEDDDAGLSTSDEDGCASTSSEDCSSSMEDGDSTSTTLAGTENDDETRQPAAKENDGSRTSLLGTIESDATSTSQLVGTTIDGDDSRQPPLAEDIVGTSTNQGAVAGDETSTSQLCGDDGVITSQTEIADGNGTSQPAATTSCGGGTSRRQPAADKARDVVVSYYRSWLCKKNKSHDNNRNGGVEIPAASIGNLTALHTLGVINVSGACGKAVLKELQKLTQLGKLGVTGIRRENFQDLLCAISGHSHLESLSVRFHSEEDASWFFSSSDGNLPKTLKSLKLYTADGHGTVQVSPVWINQLGNLGKINFGLRMSTQEDIDNLAELPNKHIFPRLCVKPTQDGELRYGWWESDWRFGRFSRAPVLEIDCGGYSSAIVFGPVLLEYVQVLVVHCSSTESSLQLSGLGNLQYLKKVTLKGSYSEAVKQHLQQQVDDYRGLNRVVLKPE